MAAGRHGDTINSRARGSACVCVGAEEMFTWAELNENNVVIEFNTGKKIDTNISVRCAALVLGELGSSITPVCRGTMVRVFLQIYTELIITWWRTS